MTIELPTSKTTISGAVAAVASFLALISLAPPELQNQVPMIFPEKYRGTITMVLGVIAGIAKLYQAKHTADASEPVKAQPVNSNINNVYPPNPKESPISPTP